MSKPKIILASASAARKKLMKKLGLPFICQNSGYEEDMSAYKNPKKLAAFLALGKATFIASNFPNALIIGADTFIVVNSIKMGKPHSISEAKKIIRRMSGKVIEVHSGLAVIKTDQHGQIVKKLSQNVVTKVTLKKMTEQEIHLLAHQKNALQISGAFSIEGPGGKMITKIDGRPFTGNLIKANPTNAYNNVIGLPTSTLTKMLAQLGVKSLF